MSEVLTLYLRVAAYASHVACMIDKVMHHHRLLDWVTVRS